MVQLAVARLGVHGTAQGSIPFGVHAFRFANFDIVQSVNIHRTTFLIILLMECRVTVRRPIITWIGLPI